MKKITCNHKGNKMEQEKDCDCEVFKVYVNKNNVVFIECLNCGTLYDSNVLIRGRSKQ